MGRRGLFLLGAMSQIIPYVVLWADSDAVGLFFGATIVSGFMPSASSMLYAAVADVVPPASRLRWFGLASSTLMVGACAGTASASMLASRLSQQGLLALSAGFGVGSLAVLTLALPETLSKGLEGSPAKLTASRVEAQLSSLWQVMFPGRSCSPEQVMLRDIAWLQFVSGLPEIGIASTIAFYAKIKLNLDDRETAVYCAQYAFLASLFSVVWNTVLLNVLNRMCSGRWTRILQICLCANFIHGVICMTMWSPRVYVLTGLLVGAGASLPTIMRAIFSAALPADVQGRASGLLAAVHGMSSVVAPIVWGALLMLGERQGCPWTPFVLGCLALLVGSWITTRLSTSITHDATSMDHGRGPLQEA